jgi:hypothetical protein
MGNNSIIKLNLRPWRLSKTSKNEFIAEVDYAENTMDNRAIAEAVAKRIGVVSEDVVLSVLNSRDEVALEAITSGKPVQDGIGRLAIKVTGPWTGDVREFDRSIHKVTVGLTLTDRAREEVEKVGFRVTGDTPTPAFIGLVTDVTTGRTDGVVTSYANIIIEGMRIKLEPLGHTDVKVAYRDSTGTRTWDLAPPALNTAKRIITRVPSLAPGTYTLTVNTFFSNGGKLLNALRVITYPLPIRVLAAAQVADTDFDVREAADGTLISGKTDAKGAPNKTPARAKSKR